METQISRLKKWISSILLMVCLILIVSLFKAYLDGKFYSLETLQQYIAGFGWMAPFILTAIQAAQVVFPVLPGFLGCVVGTLLFGWLGGLLVHGFTCIHLHIKNKLAGIKGNGRDTDAI